MAACKTATPEDVPEDIDEQTLSRPNSILKRQGLLLCPDLQHPQLLPFSSVSLYAFQGHPNMKGKTSTCITTKRKLLHK